MIDAIRGIALAALSACVLVACVPGAQPGQGDLVVSEPLVTSISDAKRRGNTLTIAVDRRLRSRGVVRCRANDKQCQASAAAKAFEKCQISDGIECNLFVQANQIVWQGPISFRESRAGQSMPFHGRWPARVDDTADIGTLELKNGRAHLRGLSSIGTCELVLTSRSYSGGSFILNCDNRPRHGGRYVIQAGPKMLLTSRSHRISVDLAKGEGQPES